jgi:DNA mismatch endonuclease (patch repair protein)
MVERPDAFMDKLSKTQRSALMARVRSKDTSPERIVRRALTNLGVRYRLNGKDILGRPDIVFKGRRRVIFVHGCFWHQHAKCRRAKRPTTRVEFWSRKLDGNVQRDKRTVKSLRAQGWSVLILWECQLSNVAALKKRLSGFLAI